MYKSKLFFLKSRMFLLVAKNYSFIQLITTCGKLIHSYITLPFISLTQIILVYDTRTEFVVKPTPGMRPLSFLALVSYEGWVESHSAHFGSPVMSSTMSILFQSTLASLISKQACVRIFFSYYFNSRFIFIYQHKLRL